jgi:Zn-dependent protease
VSYNPFYQEPLQHPGPPRIAFSRTELLHLAVAVTALTFAFSIVLGHQALGEVPRVSPRTVLTAFLAVGTGFVLHELAHKVLAQRYGHWAEFRAQFGGLGLTVLVAAFTKFLFAAPGAVLIQGRVTPRENGLISLVGPGMNLAIAAACWPLAWSTNVDTLRATLFGGIAQVNAVLCLFNLVPLGPLDGRKVLAWSKVAYLGALAVAIGTFVLVVLASPHGPPF